MKSIFSPFVTAGAAFALSACSVFAATPAELSGISGLALWLDANDFSGYATGTQISSWTDKAGNLSFTPMNNSYKPTVDNDGPRGNTVVHFVRPNSGNLKQTQALRCQNNAIKSWSQVTHTSFAVARSTLTGGNAGKENSSYVYALPGNHSGLEFWANGDYRLGNGSPLIDAGDNALVTAAMGATDLEGNARVFRAGNGGVVDIGCYEYSVSGGTLFL